MVALFIGDRSADGALGLWQALPERYRQQATFHTDDWQACKQIIPVEQAEKRHQSCGAVLLQALSTMLSISSVKPVVF